MSNIKDEESLRTYIKKNNNWGRWKSNSDAGTVNLITKSKIIEASNLVKSGRTVSLSRSWPMIATRENPQPANSFVMSTEDEVAGGAFDYISVSYHGHSVTHVDSLCHFWNKDGMWEGKSPKDEIKHDGVLSGAVDAWKNGIITRGVLIDIPKHRNEPYVTQDNPVTDVELEDIIQKQNLRISSGDAVAIYSGRELYAKDNQGTWGGHPTMPGLHASCLRFIREHDISVVIWDMLDVIPMHYGSEINVHTAISAFGVVLLDNALLEPLSLVCEEENKYEFMITINPLVIPGGTGSPVNPIAIF
tara:strand:+ start:17996 stop:18904 length:909 start_codon:yes stop_codon:yes gene_type:complete